jgi:hypothetical protein
MKKNLYIVISAIFILASSCGEKKTDFAALDQFSKNQQVEWLKKLSSIIISDIFSPPVCSRIYTYTNIAAYEALRPAYPQQFSYGNQLNGLGAIPLPDTGKRCYFPISSVMAFITVGKKLVFNADTLANMEKKFLQELDALPINDSLKAHSIAYGQKVGQFIIAWAAKDNYLQRNSHPAYLVTKDISRWQPTPPDYMDAVETNWRTLRPFTLDTVSQFRPVAPLKFDTLKNTPFYKEVLEVFETGNKLTEEQTAIAQFWDCNPNTSVTQGHVTYFQQKLSPPGHWIHLTATLTQKAGFDAMKTAEILSKTAIGMADGFISCWEAKYFYNFTRPETFINRYVDKEWKPLIQTPPFPEYPSGHSVCSGSASVILSHYFGENYAYTDNTEAAFGMPARSFKSLSEAANEASTSRFYGGIHFKNALTVGLEQGKKVGNHVLNKLK